jgi:transposase-like protein
VRLVISDAHSGLKRALREVLPCADWQRCVVHFERNILSHVSPTQQAEVGRTFSRLFQSETVKEARAKAEEFAQAYRRAFPKAVEVLQSGLEDALTFLKYPVQHQRLIRTNNGLERAFKEVRRRTKAVGVFIAGETSCVDLVSAVLKKVHDGWQQRRYLDMSVLSELSKNEES